VNVALSSLYPIAWFLVAATFAFLIHQPLEMLLGRSAAKIRTPSERNLALVWTIVFLALAALILTRLVAHGYPLLLLLAFAAASLFAIKLILGNSRSFRSAGQIIGALGLTATAPGAYYVVSGAIDATALLLWLGSWLFGAAQIEYVQLRIHTANSKSVRQRMTAGRRVYLFHLTLPVVAGVAAFYGRLPALAVLAFVPSMLRLLAWTVSEPQRLRVHWLGIGELMQSFLFNSVLAAAFIRFR
jgi:hypothetical protein